MQNTRRNGFKCAHTMSNWYCLFPCIVLLKSLLQLVAYKRDQSRFFWALRWGKLLLEWVWRLTLWLQRAHNLLHIYSCEISQVELSRPPRLQMRLSTRPPLSTKQQPYYTNYARTPPASRPKPKKCTSVSKNGANADFQRAVVVNFVHM